VDASLVRFIKGKGGFTQKKIEEEAGVRILFPSSKEDLEVTVQGASVEDVTRAMEMIKALLDEAVKSPRLDYSHFVSLPLAIYPSLVDKLDNFQNSILGVSTCQLDGDIENDQNEDFSEEEEDKSCTLAEGSTVSVNLKVQDDNEHVKVVMDNLHTGKHTTQVAKSGLSDLRIDQSIFIKPKTFHLTVLMLKLWNKDRVASAIEVLQKVSSSVWDALEGRPISIRLKGLTCMKGSPSKAGVLYAPVELHATVMNVRHRKGKKSRRHDSFDARSIIKQYGSEDWGEYLIREAHLSQRFAYDDNGYYHCCALIPFPEILEGTAMSVDAIES
ncbi:Activating signal cointegrator 1 complex subunit 1, partial [Nymphaea thermarum]